MSPIMLAGAVENCDIMRLLLDHGADVEAKSPTGVTPLVSTVFRQKAKAVECLIDGGADVDSATNNGNTPLICAANMALSATNLK